MGENAPRPRRAPAGNRNKACRRLDGLCNLTDDEKTARDKRVRDWMNQRRIERVARASGLI